MDREPTLLIADDDASVIRLLRHYLEPLTSRILTAEDGQEALELAQKELPDLVLLDVMMPQRTGWEICQNLKAVQRTSGILVVLMTARGDVKDRLTGLQVGADDYLVKPFNRNEVTWRVKRLLERASREREEVPAGVVPESFQNLVYDRVTGLPSVSLILERARERLIEGHRLGVIHIDVEQFESIEEEYGWAFFDEFLSTVAQVIRKESERLGDAELAVSRVGAPSFYLFVDLPPTDLPDELIETHAQRLHVRLMASLQERFPRMRSGEIGFFVGSNCIQYSPQIRLERQIYHGMQKAADAVRDAEQKRKQQLTREMREIIRRKRVRVLFQPIVEAGSGAIFGYELLTRGPRRSSFRNSDMLFGFAREMGLAWDLEEVALECMLRKLERQGVGERRFLVNLEAETVEAFASRFNETVTFFARYPNQFVFELTERAAIQDYAAFRDLLAKLRDRGIAIAIDDAGSGYASLEAIASLAPDYLKITKGLVSTLAIEPIKQDLIKLLVDLAHKIGARTIAEGIETEDELEWCRRLGVDLLQGYFIALPEERVLDQVSLPAMASG